MTRQNPSTAPDGQRRIAIFAATSGHSGVDRIMGNLIGQLDAWGLPVDLLHVRRHGPDVDLSVLRSARRIDLGSAHVNTVLPALVRYLRRERPRALLADKDRVNRVAILAQRIARIDTRLVVRLGTTVSANLAGRGKLERWVQRTSIRRLYPYADRVVIPSERAAADLSAYTGLAREHIHVVRSPVVSAAVERLSADPVQHPWLADGEPPVILGVGELGYRKDFETLIRAFAELRRKRRCRLIILGRGRRRTQLLALANQLGVIDHIDLPGFQVNPYAFMARAAVFVLSSRWEGMPVALIEALACGVPVVATDCPSGPREVLEGSKAGMLVPVGAPSPMAEAIEVQLAQAPRPADLARIVEPYRVDSSASAYLRVLGVEPPAEARFAT